MGIFTFCLLIINIIFLVKLSKLSERISELERRTQGSDPGQKKSAAQEQVAQHGYVVSSESYSQPSAWYFDSRLSNSGAASETAPVWNGASYEHKEDPIVTWLKDNWMLKLGAFFMVIAIGWLVTLAFANNWIGPVGRITLGFCISGIFLVAGYIFLSKEKRTEGVVMSFIGTAGVLITVFAARAAYGFFTPTSALLLMFLASLYSGYVSVLFRSRSLAVGAYSIFRASTSSLRVVPFYLAAGAAVVFLGVATALELSLPATTVAYFFEVATLVVLSRYLLRSVKVAEILSFLFIIPVGMTLQYMSSYEWLHGINQLALAILLVAAAITGVVGYLLLAEARDENEKPQAGQFWCVVASLYGLIIVWRVLHATLPPSQALSIALVFYSLLSVGLYLYGHVEQRSGFRVYGGILLGFVIGRLLVVDVWNLSDNARVVVFFAMGLLFICGAFFHKKVVKVVQ